MRTDAQDNSQICTRRLMPGVGRLRRLVRRMSRNNDGVAAIEFAFIASIMFTLFIGTVEFSQALTVDRRVTQIASSSADLIARQKTISTTEIDGVMQIIDHLMQPYDPSLLSVTVLNVQASISNANQTTVCWSYQHNGGANAYTEGQSYTLPNSFLEAGNSVIVAEVVYNYEPLIFKHFIRTTFPLRETFYLKPRQSASVDYNGNKCT